MKHLSSLADAREVVRVSFEPEIYEPERMTDWDEAYVRLTESDEHNVARTLS